MTQPIPFPPPPLEEEGERTCDPRADPLFRPAQAPLVAGVGRTGGEEGGRVVVHVQDGHSSSLYVSTRLVGQRREASPPSRWWCRAATIVGGIAAVAASAVPTEAAGGGVARGDGAHRGAQEHADARPSFSRVSAYHQRSASSVGGRTAKRALVVTSLSPCVMVARISRLWKRSE